MNVLSGTVCASMALFCLAGGGTYMDYLPPPSSESPLVNNEGVLEDHNTMPWKIVWNEEFVQAPLDPARWNVLDDPYGYGNRSQHYKPENVEVSEGNLKIHTKKEMSQGFPYTSGAVTTKGKVVFKYGKLEVRAKFPAGTGLLPAIWLWNNAGKAFPEIDIVEILGQQPGQVWSTIHYEVNRIYGKDYNLSDLPNLTTDYHTFGIEWYPEKITFFVDGTPMYTSTTFVPDEEMYLFINTGVGGDWVGEPDETTQFPTQLLVDWIRYYQK